MTRNPIRSEYDHSFTLVGETLGPKIPCRSHQWIVDSGTPERAEVRLAVYAPVPVMSKPYPSISRVKQANRDKLARRRGTCFQYRNPE